MSYDMNIDGEEFNYTYNVSSMWYASAPEKGIRSHYGMSGKDAAPVLQKMRNFMENNFDDCVEMEPGNGWGDYYGALRFLNDLIAASLRNPDEIWAGD